VLFRSPASDLSRPANSGGARAAQRGAEPVVDASGQKPFGSDVAVRVGAFFGREGEQRFRAGQVVVEVQPPGQATLVWLGWVQVSSHWLLVAWQLRETMPVVARALGAANPGGTAGGEARAR